MDLSNFKYRLIFIILCYCTISYSQPVPPPDTLWSRLYGGSGHDQSYSVEQTWEGGFIIGGYTESYGSGGKDVWLIKTDHLGVESWNRHLGGLEDDLCQSVVQTASKGYLGVGYTCSFGAGDKDGWLVCVNDLGDSLWSKTYGGLNEDYFHEIIPTEDDNYVICGWTASYGTGAKDGWLVKVDSRGDTIWTKTYGGPNNDLIKRVNTTEDGGFILTGWTESQGPTPHRNVWIVKTDSLGNENWSRVYGGSYYDEGHYTEETSDSGYIIMGWYGFSIANPDVWFIKTDGSGNSVWDETYGQYHYDIVWDGMQTEDNGFLGVGYCRPNMSNWYYSNVLVMKTDSLGYEEWTLYYGGSQREMMFSMDFLPDNGIITTGWAESFGAGGYDVWLLRFSPLNFPSLQTITLTPYGTGIIIPPMGGYVYYNLEVSNLTALPSTIDIWVDALLPNANEITILGPVFDFQLAGYQSRDKDISIYIQASAPSGMYSVIGMIGTHPSEIVDSDLFVFTKAAGDGMEGNGEIIGNMFLESDDSLIESSPHEYSTSLEINPNPFNQYLAISYQLSAVSQIKLIIYDIAGREMVKLVDGFQNAGHHEVIFDAKDLVSGVYFVRLKVDGGQPIVRKVLLVK